MWLAKQRRCSTTRILHCHKYTFRIHQLWKDERTDGIKAIARDHDNFTKSLVSEKDLANEKYPEQITTSHAH